MGSPVSPVRTRTSALAPSSLTSTTTRYEVEDESLRFNKMKEIGENWGTFEKLGLLNSKRGK